MKAEFRDIIPPLQVLMFYGAVTWGSARFGGGLHPKLYYDGPLALKTHWVEFFLRRRYA